MTGTHSPNIFIRKFHGNKLPKKKRNIPCYNWPPSDRSVSVAPPNKLANNEKECICGKGKVNIQCVLKKCKSCCGKDPQKCSVSRHIDEKWKNNVLPFVAEITSAIAESRTVYVKYDGGKKLPQFRPVVPLQWASKPPHFNARCLLDNVEKIFRTDRITAFETNGEKFNQ